MKLFICFALLLSAPAFAMDGCRNMLLRAPDTASPVREMALAFAHLRKLEKLKHVPEAKAALLYLAKSIARDAKLDWPAGLKEDELQEALWATHRSLLSGNEILLPELTVRLGASLTKLLRERGVIGINTLPNTIADDQTDLLFATQWFERRRTDAQELEALNEWREGEVGKLLKDAGKFTRITFAGVPVFRPNSLADLLRLPADSQKKILGLDLADFDMGPQEIEKLVGGNFVNLLDLDVRRNRLGSEGIKTLCVPHSPFKKVRYLDLVLNGIGDDGVLALIAPHTAFTSLTNLDLQCNAIGKATAKKVSSPESALVNLRSVIAASQRPVEPPR